MVFVGFVAFFGIIITVNALMLTLALDTMPGLDDRQFLPRQPALQPGSRRRARKVGARLEGRCARRAQSHRHRRDDRHGA
jgi:hypothetical protein